MGRRLTIAVLLAAFVTVLPSPTGEAHEGNYPIVLMPGWHGHGDDFDAMIPLLQAQGLTVLDFDPTTPGVQAMSYAPTGAGQHISYVAANIVEEKITRALRDNGYDSDTQKIDVIGHSMGGLLARFLIERPGADVDSWSSEGGWSGDGTADQATDWANRIDDLVMLGTPNHGTWEGWVPSTLGGFGDRRATGADMAPGSTFLRRLGDAAPAGEHYTAIGGDPWYLRWLADDADADGAAHGFDGVVPAESPCMTGADCSIVATHHGGLLAADAAIDLVIGSLGYTSVVDPPGQPNLTGHAIRLERAIIERDHDWGTDDDLRFEVWVDPDGNNDGYELVETLSYRRDAPFDKDWGDDGPTTPSVPLPGTSPRLDVKLVVWEHDWFLGREPVATVYFTDLMLSDDLDGMDYYESRAVDADGGTDTFRVSLNGVTSRPGDVGEPD